MFLKKVVVGLFQSIGINFFLFCHIIGGRKVLIFQLHAANQLPHIEPLLSRLTNPKVVVLLLAQHQEIEALRTAVAAFRRVKVSNYYATSWIIFWHVTVSLDQRMRFPLVSAINNPRRLCIFHGQPTKGNVYSSFNYQQIDGLFFYGPLMKNLYLREKGEHAQWPDIEYWETGQPKSDLYFGDERNVPGVIGERFPKERPIVLYAPSFEAESSLAMYGKQIISALSSLEINLLVKPHPSFFRKKNEGDKFFDGVPHRSGWRKYSEEISRQANVCFPIEEQMNTIDAVAGSTVLITDHSGIAFDAILLDRPVIFFDCPKFFDQYLPDTYGIDGEAAREDLLCNAGRVAGRVVGNVRELEAAVEEAIQLPNKQASSRAAVASRLLYNKGNAANHVVDVLNKMLE
jgi:hypothetical protein